MNEDLRLLVKHLILVTIMTIISVVTVKAIANHNFKANRDILGNIAAPYND